MTIIEAIKKARKEGKEFITRQTFLSNAVSKIQISKFSDANDAVFIGEDGKFQSIIWVRDILAEDWLVVDA